MRMHDNRGIDAMTRAKQEREGARMTRDPGDPAYDPRRYCERCLAHLPEDWLREHDSDEWPECPRCKRHIDRVLTFHEPAEAP